MIPGRTLGKQVQNHLGQSRSESHTPNGGSRHRQDIDIDRALEPSDTEPTRREFLGAAAAAGTTAVAGCGNNTDETGTEREAADTPLQDTAEPADETTEAEAVETPEETSELEELLEDATPAQERYKNLLQRYGLINSFGDNTDIENSMREGVSQGGECSPPYIDRESYLNSGAAYAVAKTLEHRREENPHTKQEALGLHNTNADVKRVVLAGKEADVAVVEDTQEDEIYLATNVGLAPREEGSDAAVYRVGTEPEDTTQELLKELTNPDKVGSGTSMDWESWREAVEETRDYDEEADARYLSKLLGDIVAGASVTHDALYNSTEDVPYPMLWTHEFHKQLSKGSSLGLIDRTEEITNKVAETDRASSEIYVVGKGGEVVTAELPDKIPRNLDEI